ncbi:hypothetical protein BAE44_0021025 [Dichanthelium oligosanthes]|uniref:Uncharacterized protein n=1 Tax=Dichanthelium oligosanthes TaxID=888268 RepID=A0A1E5UYP9_9POAL|nr:hypothetical protein BAE44_0021025 [Dichanthelium oligosanthes]
MTKQLSVQSGAAATVCAPVAEKTAAGGRGVEATEEQARAIISMAKRAVEEEAKIRGDGAAAIGKPSLKRSLECFLEGRKKKVMSSAANRRRLESSPATTSWSSN